MNKAGPTSAELIDDLVRQLFGVEPAVMAALAHGDEQVRARFMPDDEPMRDPVDELGVLVRRSVALCLALAHHPGSVSLVTERQATAAGWPSAKLANRSITLAWALFVSTQPGLGKPLLLEAAEEGRDFMDPLIRVDTGLPDCRDLLALVLQDRQIDCDDMERAAAACENAPLVANVSYVSMEKLLADWFGVDAGAIDLEADIFGTRMEGSNARAVVGLKWLITAALELGSVIEREEIAAVRLKIERDAQLAGEPGAALANGAALLGVAIRHARGLAVHLLPPRDDLATAIVEAGRRARERCLQEGDGLETRAIEMLELQDLAARGYVHVGLANVREVAWRQIRGEA